MGGATDLSVNCITLLTLLGMRLGSGLDVTTMHSLENGGGPCASASASDSVRDIVLAKMSLAGVSRTVPWKIVLRIGGGGSGGSLGIVSRRNADMPLQPKSISP